MPDDLGGGATVRLADELLDVSHGIARHTSPSTVRTAKLDVPQGRIHLTAHRWVD
jgi:hypothetical protein